MSAGSDHHGDLPKVKSDIGYYWPVTKHYGSTKASSLEAYILLGISYFVEGSCKFMVCSLVKPNPAAPSGIARVCFSRMPMSAPWE